MGRQNLIEDLERMYERRIAVLYSRKQICIARSTVSKNETRLRNECNEILNKTDKLLDDVNSRINHLKHELL